MSALLSMSNRTESSGTGSMLRHLGPLRRSTDSLASNIHLDSVEGLSAEFRRLLQRHGNPDSIEALRAASTAMAANYGLPNEKIDRFGGMLRERPLVEATDEMIAEGATSPLYLLAFARASQLEYEQRMSRDAVADALAGRHPVMSPLCLPGKATEEESNHLFLLQNAHRNYLRLPGILPAIQYDQLHARVLYRFTFSRDRTDFVEEMNAYRNGGPPGKEKLFEKKEILTLGPGRGRDEEYMMVHGGAASVEMIDGSACMLPRLEKVRRGLDQGLQGSFVLPAEPADMLEALRRFAAENRTFDTVYAHSSIHYFDDETLEEVLGLIRVGLTGNGHLVFAVKAPGAVLDGNGIPLIRDIETLSSSRGAEYTQERVRHRMWLNFDGQTRMFRDKSVWSELVGKHFTIPRVTEHSVEHYETEDQRAQTFYYFVCKNTLAEPSAGRRPRSRKARG